jgi:uncharacterized membrane protein YdjX (TVP38/TMEM64 family)
LITDQDTQDPGPETKFDSEEGKETSVKKKGPLLRLLGLVLVLGGLFLVGHLTGFNENFDKDALRKWVQDSGPLGSIGLIAAFTVGLLVQVPGLLFVFVSIWVYGQLMGGILAHLGGVVALSVTFLVVRAVGGKPLGEIKNKYARKIFSKLEDYPITTVIVLRLLLWYSPPMNYALALSGVRFRDYVIGSALGLLPVVAVIAVFFEAISPYLDKF